MWSFKRRSVRGLNDWRVVLRGAKVENGEKVSRKTSKKTKENPKIEVNQELRNEKLLRRNPRVWGSEKRRLWIN